MADYNINAITRRVVFTGSAGLGPYAFSFEVLDENDVAVYFNATLLTLTTDYTVTVNANGTGSVTIVTGSSVPSTPTASDQIVIVGARDIERVTDFVTAGDLLASSLNEQLDALTIFDQQVAEENKRAIRAPVYDPALVEDGGVVDMTLPSKASRAGKLLAFDSDGNPSVGEEIGNWRGNWAASTAYSVRDIVKDASNDNIYRCNTAHTSSGSTPISSNTDSAKWDLVIDASAAASSASTASDHRADAGKYAVTAHNTTFTLTATNGGTSGLYSALHYATESSNSASAASTSETNAATSETNAQDWAIKTNGIVDSVGYSAKAWSIGGTGVTNTAGSGAAQEWATKTTANVDGTEYSAKEYAVGTQTRGTTGSAKDWATYTAGTVDGSGYSAKYWAEQAAASADSFDDTYLGPKSSAPSVDNDGDPLTAGDLYFDTGVGAMYVYTGSAWQQVAPSTAGFATNGFAIAMAIAL